MKRPLICLFAFMLTVAGPALAAGAEGGAAEAAGNGWLGELGGVLVLMALGGAIVFLINLRLQRQVSVKTKELHVSEDLRREVEDRWRLAVMGLNVGIWEYNFATQEMYFSPSWKEMLGYAPDELADRREEFWGRIHPEDRAAAETALSEHLAGRSEHYTVECRLRCKDGRYKWIRSRGQAQFDAAGKPARLIGAHADIDERRRAEAALRESSERYRALFESNPGPMWVYDQESLRFVMVNAAAVREYGFTREEFLRLTIFDIRSPAEAERLRGMLAQWRPGDHRPALWRHQRKDGTQFYVEVSTCDHEFDGRPGVLVVVRDVTERHLAQEKLNASEERYRFMVEHSPFGVVEHDYREVMAWLEERRAAGVTDLAAWIDAHPAELAEAVAKVRAISANRATLRLVGTATLEEAVAVLPQVFGSGIIGLRRENLLALWQGRLETEAEFTMHALDGLVRRVYHRWWVPVIGGRPQYERTQLTLVDLTEIRAAESALAAGREQLSVTLRAMAEGVLTTDQAGVVRFANEAAEGLTGWRDGAAIGRRIDEVCVLRHEHSKAEVPVPVAAAMAGHRFADLPLNTALLDRQGVPRLVEGRCAPIHDAQNRAVGTVLVLRDVTERARLESELMRASRLESIGILAGGIAHDFNNLLTAVMGNLALAMLEPPVMAVAGQWLRDAERGVLRTRDLTQQLLTFARGGEPVLGAVQLPEVVREAAEFALHGSKVRAEFATGPDLWPAKVDKGQIGQVVQNLVINAVQAMPDGGVVRIAMHNQTLPGGAGRPLEAGRYLCIEITDQGEGIRPEHLGQIFDPYFTTKKTGNGLGLATVYSIIRRHQGHIEVESVPGRGATFRFWLPTAEERAPRKNESASPFGTASGRLLFMDDEEPIRVMAQALLSRMGFDVTTAAEGAEAVRIYAAAQERGEPFELVIMDLTVPGGIGGAEAIVELRKLDPKVKAIVSSGYSSDPILANFEAYGFRGVVPKPYRLTDLAKAIRAVLER